MPRAPALHLAWLLLSGMTCAQAQNMEIKWGADGRYSRSVTIAAGKTHEFCGEIKSPQKLAWTFESSQPLGYAAYRADAGSKRPADSTTQGWRFNGALDAPSSGRYCWSWVNAGDKTVELAFDVQQQPR